VSQSVAVNAHARSVERAQQRPRARAVCRAAQERGVAHEAHYDEPDPLATEDLRRAERVAMRRAVDDAIVRRQGAVADQQRAGDEFAELLALAHAAFSDFRVTANTLFIDRRYRTALGLIGRIPVDTRAFVKMARAAYRVAQQESRQTTLALVGYDVPTLQAALDSLDGLLAARQTLVRAMSHTAFALINFAGAEYAMQQPESRSTPARKWMAAGLETMAASD
jgi:hypothetical protein